MTRPAEQYACLCAREFPAQALLRLRPELRERPCVVVEGEPPLEQVCSLNSRARTLGVAQGMTRVELDTFSDVVVLTRSPAEEGAARAALLEAAGGFSPRVEEVEDRRTFLCVVDIAGTEKLFGTPDELGRKLLQRVSGLGVAGSVSVSRNFDAAISMARGMAGRKKLSVVPCGEEAAVLAGLPLWVLDISAEHAEILALWGIQTLGMLAALPERELIARLGQEGQRLLQMARGERPHLFLPAEPAFSLEERMELESPVELLDSLLFVVGVMLEQLILRAQARVLALAAVTITLKLDGGATHARTVQPALPANDRKLWIKLLHLDLEAHPPPAAIVALTLTAEPGKTSKMQLGLFSPQLPEPARLDVTLARIRAIAGEDSVGRAVLKDSHLPDSFRMEAFAVSMETSADAATDRTPAAMRQLRPPEGLTVTVEGGRPQSFVFREKRYLVERKYGPWRMSGEWWSEELWGQEQWDLVARAQDGSVLCCCATYSMLSHRWQMAALYD